MYVDIIIFLYLIFLPDSELNTKCTQVQSEGNGVAPLKGS